MHLPGKRPFVALIRDFGKQLREFPIFPALHAPRLSAIFEASLSKG